MSNRHASELIARLRAELAGRHAPLFVALDGRSGAGKTMLAIAVASGLRRADDDDGVVVIEGDQFYAGGSAATWDRRTTSEKAAGVIDWRRQRAVLLELREQGAATWRPFDWEAADWDADRVPLAREPVRCRAGSVVMLEGAYSCRPELHDLLDLRVLLQVPRDVRRRRLLDREGEAYRADWEARWSTAEDHYFDAVMPPSAFDVVLGSEAA